MAADGGDNGTKVWVLTGVVLLCAAVLGWFATDKSSAIDKKLETISETSTRTEIKVTQALDQNKAEQADLTAIHQWVTVTDNTVRDLYARMLSAETQLSDRRNGAHQ